jgi:hypothetical protein
MLDPVAFVGSRSPGPNAGEVGEVGTWALCEANWVGFTPRSRALLNGHALVGAYQAQSHSSIWLADCYSFIPYAEV